MLAFWQRKPVFAASSGWGLVLIFKRDFSDFDAAYSLKRDNSLKGVVTSPPEKLTGCVYGIWKSACLKFTRIIATRSEITRKHFKLFS